MAIVINSNPATYSSVNDDLIFVVYEATKATDPTTYPNYKYVCDVYINGEMTRLTAFPHPDNNRGIFNIGQIVRSYINLNFNPTANVLEAQELESTEFWLSVQCKFGEEVDYVLTTDLTVDSARVYFNHYNARINNGLTSILSAFTNKPVTHRPTQTNVLLDQDEVFIPYYPTTNSAFNVVITAYPGATTQTLVVTPAAANNLQQLNVGPTAINAFSTVTITDSTTYYTVSFNGILYLFNLIDECKYEPYTLHFLNQFGGFESFIFPKVSRKSNDIERKSFGKQKYRVDGSGVVSTYNSKKVYNETSVNYSTTFTEKLVLNSDLLTDDLYQWLGELVRSPLVYLQEGEYFTPVTIAASNYDYRKTVNDKLTSLRLELAFGNEMQTQSR